VSVCGTGSVNNLTCPKVGQLEYPRVWVGFDE
jgi:hypothetical protein